MPCRRTCNEDNGTDGNLLSLSSWPQQTEDACISICMIAAGVEYLYMHLQESSNPINDSCRS